MNGKTGNLGNEVKLQKEKNMLTLTSEIPFSKRWEFVRGQKQPVCYKDKDVKFQREIYPCRSGTLFYVREV